MEESDHINLAFRRVLCYNSLISCLHLIFHYAQFMKYTLSKVCIYGKNIAYTGFGVIYSLKQPQGVVECVAHRLGGLIHFNILSFKVTFFYNKSTKRKKPQIFCLIIITVK